MPEPSLEQLKINRSQLAARPRRSRKRLWLIVAVVAVLGVSAVITQRYTGGTEVETVSVTTAYPYQAVTLLNAAGYVVAQRKAAIASKASGRLEWLGVVEGSAVKEGEVLARIENKDVSASADQARANIALVQAEEHDAQIAYKRAKELVAQKYVSQSAVDTAEARYLKARASVGAAKAGARAAEVAVDQTLIRAPFDGVVLTKNANVGDTVTPFSASLDTKGAVVTVADMSTLEVEADVSESSLQKISVGQPCEIQLDAFPDMRFRGVVSRLVPTVDRSKATVMTKVRFIDRDPGNGQRILPEMSAKVAFLSKEVPANERKPLTVVNPDAIVKRDGANVVFVVTDGHAQLAKVDVGAKLGDAVVVSGVKSGDKVVLKPHERLRDGMAVTLVQK